MRFLGCVLLLLCACSSGPAPRTYRQGAFVPVEAPAFSPVEDAPHTMGQPGYVGNPDSVPRGTDRRVLPPTREAGIWASDGQSPKVAPILFLGFHIPAPDDAEKEEDIGIARMCSNYFGQSLFNSPDLASEATSLPQQRKFCLAIQVLKMCLEMDGIHEALNAEPLHPASKRMLERLKKTTDSLCEKYEAPNRDLVSRFVLYVSHRKFERPIKGPKQ